jgi:RNA polymerase sigma factor (sigma-70 family)
MAIGRLEAVGADIRTLFGVGTLAGMTDAELLRRFASRRDPAAEAAFRALVARHGPMVLGVCRQLLGDPHDAEDAFQATFLVLARKAGSIRDAELLGNWLYGVALRTASKSKVQRARRRKRQEQEAAMSSAEPAWETGNCESDWSLLEHSQALHEELGRLPDKFRVPIVLCYLEGVSQDETARRLRCPVGTIRSRLARARDRLRGRLLRRGVALPVAAVAAFAAESAKASVPEPLVETTIRAATQFATGRTATGLVSASAAALTREVLRTMFLTKLIPTAGALLLLGGLAWFALAAAPFARGNDTPAAAPTPASAKPAAPAATEKRVDVRGRVVELDSGQPIAGAAIELSPDPSSTDSAGRVARASTGADGQFRVTVRTDGLSNNPKIIAQAKGYGPDWSDLNTSMPEDVVLKLPKDDVPIDGRIVDLEGQPVADVKIELGHIFKTDDGKLDAYLATVKEKDLYYTSADFGLLKHASAHDLGLPAHVMTDADGRFRITGAGRNRVVHIVTRGKTIEHDSERIVTMAGTRDLPKSVNPAQFVHHSAPSKPIVGTVRVKKTAKPAAGVRLSMDGHQQTTTDEQGHYRLEGIAKRARYSVWATGDGYFQLLKMDIADTPGLEPLTVDIEIEQGVPIKGRVIDKVTGLPVQANVEFVPYSSNPNLADYTPQPFIYQGKHTRADGSFTVVGIPGPGLLCVSAEGGQYLSADTTALDQKPRTDYGFPLTSPPKNPGDFNALVPIDTPADPAKAIVHEITVQSGAERTVELVDPDGKPIEGAHVAGREPKRQMMGPIPDKNSRKIAGSKFTAVGLDPNHGRYLVIIAPDRKLGKLQPIRGGDAGALKVMLEPLGGFKGRVVGASGKPLAGLIVTADAPRELNRYWKDDPSLPEEVMFGFDQPGTLPERFRGTGTTAADGTFTIDGLIPGFPYVIHISEPGQRGFITEHFSRGTATKPSATADLGELKVQGR